MKPILFNTQMVQAILKGRKTMTRRLIKPQPKSPMVKSCGTWQESQPCANGIRIFSPPVEPGDILYVRETWRCYEASSVGVCTIEYKAGGREEFDRIITLPTAKGEWKPSIHMPKEAARIFLRVKSVRAEQLKQITVADGYAEGLMIPTQFDALWDSTIKPADRALYGWDANPWVWVIEFERCEKPGEVS